MTTQASMSQSAEAFSGAIETKPRFFGRSGGAGVGYGDGYKSASN